MNLNRFLPGILGPVALLTAGCGLIPIPYTADVTGPIAGVRVLDLQTGEDIAGAKASFGTGIATANWLSSQPPLFAAVGERETEDDALERTPLSRDAGGVFQVRKLHGVGFVRPFGIGPLGTSLYNPPIGVVQVSAPGYPGAELLYYAGARPEPGWSAAAEIPCEPAGPGSVQAGREGRAAEAPRPIEDARCVLDEKGILRFYLRRPVCATSS